MLRSILAATVAAALVAATPAYAIPDEDKPDLAIELPGEPYPGQPFPVYVDAFQEPGKLLYRFDSIIRNEGGTLDIGGTGTACGRRCGPAGS